MPIGVVGRFALPVVLLAATGAPAQQAITVNGIAWDSTRREPLIGAIVILDGSRQSAVSDSLGRFRFEGVPPGALRVSFVHAVLDSLGLSVVSVSRTAKNPRDTIVLSVPTFGAEWRALCGGRPPVADSGILFGRIRDAADGREFPGVLINLTWGELTVAKGTGLVQRRWGGEVRSESDGVYRVCGVPTDVVLSAVVSTGSTSTTPVQLLVGARRFLRQDLAVVAAADSARRGMIAGVALNDDGRPVLGARVSTQGMQDVYADSGGRFLIRGVPLGTRFLEVTAMGASPAQTLVDVGAQDTAHVQVRVSKVVQLDPIAVHAATARQRRLSLIEKRRTSGIGDFMDSLTIERHATLREALTMMTTASHVCAVFLDGVPSTIGELGRRSIRDLALLEAHRGTSVALPAEFRTKQCERALLITVIAWTKLGLR